MPLETSDRVCPQHGSSTSRAGCTTRPEAAFDHITDICSVDYPNDTERFGVIYQLLSLAHRRRIRLKVRITEDHPGSRLRDRHLEGRGFHGA